jgi:hypothetical protein
MTWANSGIYASVLGASLTVTANAPNWSTAANNKFALTSNSDVTAYNAALASAIWGNHSATEITGTGWAAGGPTMATANAGGTMTPAITVSGTSPVLMVWGITAGISISGTTLTGAYGGYFYSTTTTQYLMAGIYFGGTGYSTVGGIFGVSWSGLQIATISVAANA